MAHHVIEVTEAVQISDDALPIVAPGPELHFARSLDEEPDTGEHAPSITDVVMEATAPVRVARHINGEPEWSEVDEDPDADHL